VAQELVEDVGRNGLAMGMPVSGKDGPANARWEALMAFRDALAPHLSACRRVWDETFHACESHRPGPLHRLSPHLGLREKRAYTLWKTIGHRLRVLRGVPCPGDLMLVQPDVTVTLEEIRP
jgi:hypothetical protein